MADDSYELGVEAELMEDEDTLLRAKYTAKSDALRDTFAVSMSLWNDEEDVLSAMRDIIESEPLARIDYVEMVDADSIEPVTKVHGRVLAAMAVFIGKTRLIDNFIVENC